MEEILTALLLAAETSAGTAVGWGRRDQGGPDTSIVLHRKSGLGAVSYDGATGWTSSRVQVDCWGRTYSAARLLAREAKAALQTCRTAPIQGVFVLSDSDPADEDGSNGQTADTNLSRSRLDLRVCHIEP
jgi:hypothetical protein